MIKKLLKKYYLNKAKRYFTESEHWINYTAVFDDRSDILKYIEQQKLKARAKVIKYLKKVYGYETKKAQR